MTSCSRCPDALPHVFGVRARSIPLSAGHARDFSPLAGLTSGVHEPLRGDPEEDKELALELGQFGIESLDDATVRAQEVALEGSEQLQDPVSRGGLAVAILRIER